jgi:hypothetical protein
MLTVREPYNRHNEMETLQNMIMTGMAAQGHALSPEQAAALAEVLGQAGEADEAGAVVVFLDM